MKKLLSVLLAAALLASLSVPAMAAVNTGGNTSANVTGTYREGAGAQDTVSAEIVWEEMVFTYTESSKTWNPDTHQYEQIDGKWEYAPKYITVSNHSNVPLMTEFFFEGIGDVKGSFPQNTVMLESAEGKTLEDTPQAKVLFSIYAGTITKNQTLGTITVRITNVHAISTPEALQKVAYYSGSYVLGADIALENPLDMKRGTESTLDLNGKTLSNDSHQVVRPYGKQTIKNGALVASGRPHSAVCVQPGGCHH